jgi:hypothetical protein
VTLLVTGHRSGRRPARDPRGDEGDLLVGEVAEQGFQPARRQLHVGVDERDQGSRDSTQTGVPGDGRSGIGAEAEDLGALDRRHRGVGCVVDHDHGRHARATGDDVPERGGVDAERRHDDGHVARRMRGALGSRVDRPRVEEPVDELGRCDVAAAGDLVEGADPGPAEAEQPQRRTADDDVVGDPPGRAVELVPRHGGVRP